MMIYNAIRSGIFAGFQVIGFLLVAAMVYCFIAALVCFSDWLVDRALGEDDEEDEEMDD